MLTAAKPLCAHGYNFAISLGLPPDLVGRLEKENNDTANFLSKILTKWLNCNYDTKKHGFPSWRSFCSAAADPVGGANNALAKEIAEQHKIGNYS